MSDKKWKVTYDHYGTNRDVPLYTKTHHVHAGSGEEAIATIKKLVGGRNHKAELAEDVLSFSKYINEEEDKRYAFSKAINPFPHTGIHKKQPKPVKAKNTLSSEEIKAAGDWLRQAKPKLKEETVDKITMSVPLLIRCLEWAHEDAKDDVEIHQFVENIIAKGGELETKDYNGLLP